MKTNAAGNEVLSSKPAGRIDSDTADYLQQVLVEMLDSVWTKSSQEKGLIAIK